MAPSGDPPVGIFGEQVRFLRMGKRPWAGQRLTQELSSLAARELQVGLSLRQRHGNHSTCLTLIQGVAIGAGLCLLLSLNVKTEQLPQCFHSLRRSR